MRHENSIWKIFEDSKLRNISIKLEIIIFISPLKTFETLYCHLHYILLTEETLPGEMLIFLLMMLLEKLQTAGES